MAAGGGARGMPPEGTPPLRYGQDSVRHSLAHMSADQPRPTQQVLRPATSNSCSPHSSQSASTVGEWQFDDTPRGWKTYGVSEQRALNAARVGRRRELTLAVSPWSYSIDLVAMTQTNVRTGKVRQMRVRPLLGADQGRQRPSSSGSGRGARSSGRTSVRSAGSHPRARASQQELHQK